MICSHVSATSAAATREFLRQSRVAVAQSAALIGPEMYYDEVFILTV